MEESAVAYKEFLAAGGSNRLLDAEDGSVEVSPPCAAALAELRRIKREINDLIAQGAPHEHREPSRFKFALIDPDEEQRDIATSPTPYSVGRPPR